MTGVQTCALRSTSIRTFLQKDACKQQICILIVAAKLIVIDAYWEGEMRAIFVRVADDKLPSILS